MKLESAGEKQNKDLLNKLNSRQRPFPWLMASVNRIGLEGFKGLRLTVRDTVS